ncbi:MAG: hypothetical protein HZB14_03785 [Actinobacteria bacterium]|nr:hypothetical protein [Actinomycetota bacterium]
MRGRLRRCAGLAGLASAVAAYALVFRPLMLTWGATEAENAATYPGDDLVEGGERQPVMATTLDAPPSEVWPWLAQMGCDRAGFYSWDRLDNGGRPSARELNPDWAVATGDRIRSTTKSDHWFDVALADPPHTLILRAPMVLPSGRMFDPATESPESFSDSTWAFHLRELPGGRTRLIVGGVARAEPRLPNEVSAWLFWEPVHWVMQTKQFRELRRRTGKSQSPA